MSFEPHDYVRHILDYFGPWRRPDKWFARSRAQAEPAKKRLERPAATHLALAGNEHGRGNRA